MALLEPLLVVKNLMQDYPYDNIETVGVTLRIHCLLLKEEGLQAHQVNNHVLKMHALHICFIIIELLMRKYHIHFTLMLSCLSCRMELLILHMSNYHIHLMPSCQSCDRKGRRRKKPKEMQREFLVDLTDVQHTSQVGYGKIIGEETRTVGGKGAIYRSELLYRNFGYL